MERAHRRDQADLLPLAAARIEAAAPVGGLLYELEVQSLLTDVPALSGAVRVLVNLSGMGLLRPPGGFVCEPIVSLPGGTC
jgi:hypothetical protein